MREIHRLSVLDQSPVSEAPGFHGSPARLRAGLEELAAAYGADEVIVVTITHDHDMRTRSYELIAGELGLAPGPGSPRSALRCGEQAGQSS
jgi:alkanesulfonate monooxygenase SsuD/methylene tetrahydromethanopterin reductase-like flavin-dependent oxidoreductase (luciferase family)